MTAIVDLARQFYVNVKNNQQAGFQSQFDAIDPKSTDAFAQYSALKEKRGEALAETRAQYIDTIKKSYDVHVATVNAMPNGSEKLLLREEIKLQIAEAKAINANTGTFTETLKNAITTAKSNEETKAAAVEKKSAAAANDTAEPAAPAPVTAAAPPAATGDDAAKPVTAGTTTSAAAGPTVDQPGARDYNPLSQLSSYTYNISLYMITPESYADFTTSGKVDTSKFILVCQSGGSAKTGTGPFPLDFYIDDLTFKTFCSTKVSDGPIVDSVDFEFKIYEPYGFSFVSRLKAAALDTINKSNLPGIKKATHHMQQHYMLGIKFYGYDSAGNVSKGITSASDSKNDGSLFPRYFPIYLTHLNFKLDGRATTYSIKAQTVSMNVAAGVLKNTIKSHLDIKGGTVAEILSGKTNYSLTGVMNAQEQAKYNASPGNKLIQMPNIYHIDFVGPNSKDIADAKLVNPNDIPKYKSPINNNANVSEANDKNSLGLNFDKTTQTYQVTAGASVTQIIDNIISQSSYVRDALNSFQTESDAGNQVEVNANPNPLKWYIIVPIVESLGYDEIICGMAYSITYQVREYLVPYVRSAYVSKTTRYHGAHKRYKYIYTGENNEIINYEQTYNSLYYMNSLRQPADNTSPPVEVNVGARSDQSDSGLNNLAGQAAATIKTSLYSPGDKALAKISILGDPDYLMTTMGMEYQVYKKFYGEDYSINAHAGQIFIEISFNEVSDYDTSTGLMPINNQVEVYRYPPELKIVGISYLVNDVSSTFSRGRFTQDLNLVLWSPPFKSELSKSAGTAYVEETNRAVLAKLVPGLTKPTGSAAPGAIVGTPVETPPNAANASVPASAKTATTSGLFGVQGGQGVLGTNTAGKQTADDDNSTTVADARGYSPRSSFTI